MAAMTMASGLPSPSPQSDGIPSTLPDPRTPLTPPEMSRTNSISPHHPELSNEVAHLSNKLIHAINHQTDLDDTLSETRHQLETAQERAKQFERLHQEHRSMVDNHILVKWEDVENDVLRLRTNLAEERRMRVQVEKDKKAIEQELESLTTALFEEANQVVLLDPLFCDFFQLKQSRWSQPQERKPRRTRKGWKGETSSCRLSSTMPSSSLLHIKNNLRN